MKLSLSCIISIVILISCTAENEGCTNYWAKNFKEEAEIDCCCKYDADLALEKAVGKYRVKANCSSGTSTYNIQIVVDQAEEEQIILSNIFNDSEVIRLKFNEGSFSGDNELKRNGCIFLRSVVISPDGMDLQISFDQKIVNGDCGFQIDVNCTSRTKRI